MSMTDNKFDAAIVSCKSYTPDDARHALTGALSAIGGLDFVRSGMKIVIKANLVSAKKPDTATTTHPVLIAELTKMLTERGAHVVIGDSPGGLYNSAWLSGVYNSTGMKLCEEAGAELNRNFSVKETKYPEGKVLHDFKYTAYLDDADVIIDFAKLKTHGMMVMSAAVKNLFGTIPGTTKPEYHSRFPEISDFADMLIDLYEYFKPRISLIDAVYGMEGNGPTAGTPKYVGALIASKSGHLADMVGASVMGIPLSKLPLHVNALRRGLCPDTMDDIKIYGNIESFKASDYALIQNASSDFGLVIPRPLAWLSDKVFRTRPKLSPKKCIGCGVCFNTCPQKAITMTDNKPVYDYDKCIRCYCCQEFCPRGAITVHKTLIARIINR